MRNYVPIRYGYTQCIEVPETTPKKDFPFYLRKKSTSQEHTWTRKNNPVCTECFVQKSNSGSCNC
jgi:hypothetical protein